MGLAILSTWCLSFDKDEHQHKLHLSVWYSKGRFTHANIKSHDLPYDEHQDIEQMLNGGVDS